MIRVILIGMVALGLVLALMSGCDRQPRTRSNPLDPQNPATGGRPQGLRSIAAHQSIHLSWQHFALESLTGYRLVRQESGGSETITDVTGSPLPDFFVDGSVVNGRTYTYHLIALIQKKNDGSLIASPASDPTVATPGPEICWLLDDGADRMLTIASDARSVAREVVSIFGARHLAVDRLDGGCWTTTRFGGAEFGPVAIRFTAQGAQDVILTGFTAPASVAVDPRDGSVWIADVGGTLNGVSSVSRLTRRGILFFQRTGFTNPAALAVEPGTGDCWVADRGAGVLKRISTNGDIVATAGPIGLPGALAVDPADGDCWGIDESAKTVFRVGPDGTRLATIGGFNSPERIAFNAYSNALWITEPDAGRVILLNADAPDGYHLDQRPDFHSVITGFVSPADVSVDPVSGNVWIPDSEGRSLYKMGPDGRQKQRLSGIPFPVATAVDPGPR